MDGMYAMYYTGTASCGHAIFSMKNGLIAGADAVGGLLDGTYKEAGDGNIDISVTLKSLPGTGLVTGKTVERDDLPQKITATLPVNFWGGLHYEEGIILFIACKRLNRRKNCAVRSMQETTATKRTGLLCRITANCN